MGEDLPCALPSHSLSTLIFHLICQSRISRFPSLFSFFLSFLASPSNSSVLSVYLHQNVYKWIMIENLRIPTSLFLFRLSSVPYSHFYKNRPLLLLITVLFPFKYNFHSIRHFIPQHTYKDK